MTNIVLDYVLIAWGHMGIAGAALATVINWVVASLIPLFYFLWSKNSPLKFGRLKWRWKALGRSCMNGSSEMVTNLSVSFIAMLYNMELIRLIGSDGVVAYGVIQYIAFIFMAVYFGYNLAVSPVVAYHYGAGNKGELKSLLRKSLVIIGLSSIILTVVAEMSAWYLAMIFVSYSEALMELTTHAIRVYSLCFLFTGFNVFTSGFFTALNNGVVSAILSFVRTFILQAASVILLPIIWGVTGIWLASMVSEVMAGFLSAFYLAREKKRYGY